MSAAAALKPVAEPSLRDVLRELIALRPARHEAVQRANAMIDRARTAIEAAEADLGRFADLDARVAAERARMVKADLSGPLPDALIAERTAHRAARERVEEARAALKVLEAEHATAQDTLRRHDAAIHTQAVKVLLQEGTRLADELVAAKRRTWALEVELIALDTALGAALTAEQKYPLREMFARLAKPFNMPPQGKDGPPHLAQPVLARWRNLLAALQQDASAPVEPEV